MPQKAILYVEDDEMNIELAEMTMLPHFPEYHFIMNLRSLEDVKQLLGRNDFTLDDIALVCADGQLMGYTSGIQVMEFLRERGYNGPAIYIGYSSLPSNKEHLFVARSGKFADSCDGDLVGAIRAVLKEYK